MTIVACSIVKNFSEVTISSKSQNLLKIKEFRGLIWGYSCQLEISVNFFFDLKKNRGKLVNFIISQEFASRRGGG